MRKGSVHRRSDTGREAPGNQLIAVAIDSDKTSQHALKWAADHVVARGQIFILLHVRKKITTIPTPSGSPLPISMVEQDVAATYMEQINNQTKDLILPFQCFCSRRGLQCKEVIVEDTDVPKAIVGFIAENSIDTLVMGASSKNAFVRTLKTDVPTAVSKAAPSFCSVYIISKGKISSIRPASQPIKNPIRAPHLDIVGTQFQSTKSEPDASHRTDSIRRSTSSYRPLGPNVIYESGTGGQGDNCSEYSYHSTISCPSPSRAYGELHLGGTFSRETTHSLRAKIVKERPAYAEQTKYFDWKNDDGGYSSFSVRSDGSESSSAFGRESGWSSSSGRSMISLQEDLGTGVKRSNVEQKINPYDSVSGEEDDEFVEWRRSSVPRSGERPRTGETDQKSSSDQRKQIQEMIQNKKVLEGLSTNVSYRKYDIEEIQRATDNFSDELKIGEGGYGPVFRANMENAAVAIKVLRPDAVQGAKQFQQEIEVLSNIRHPNMVLLMGACPEYGCIVYEYMENGSLEDRLFRRSNTPPLSWQLRFKIAAEIAAGLLFLHQTKPEPLVHRDLKPGNILLDHNFVSKIADVGLARLVPASVADAVTQYRMTVAAGTFCYIDPEYQQTGLLGIKSDIYALGIILLQLITASPPMGLAHAMDSALEEGRLHTLLDPTVPDWPMEETLSLAKLGLQCAELRKKDRPALATVILPQLKALAEMAQSAPQSSNLPRYYHLLNQPESDRQMI